MRIWSLYKHFWIIQLSFLFIGCFLKSDRYPGSVEGVILNFSSFHTTWNPECWFLFPYSILSLFSVQIFRLTDKLRIRWVLLTSFLMYLVSGFLISILHIQYMNSSPLLYYSLYIPNMLLCFLMGAMVCRCNLFDKVRSQNRMVMFLVVVAASFLKMYVHSAVLSPFYAFLVVIALVAFLEKKECILLSLLGRHSMNIWLMHTWLLSYLFGKYLYSLCHPILIIIALLLICLILSNAVDWIFKKQTLVANIMLIQIKKYFKK